MATAVKAELIEDGPDKENQVPVLFLKRGPDGNQGCQEVEELPDFGGEEEQNDSKNEAKRAHFEINSSICWLYNRV